jgi:cutinase
MTPAFMPANGSLPSASAACPAVEVVFARGRLESPGVGILGNAFISALRSKSNKNIGTYAVNYPADTQIDIGANDMSAHIQSMVNNCPDTRLVLGGYSLGAGVTDVVLAVPFDIFTFKNPLPPGADQHIAAVALFGNGIAWVAPISNFNPVYRDRTIELCHGADPICNPADPDTWKDNWPAHLANAYIQAGMANQAADFVAARI